MLPERTQHSMKRRPSKQFYYAILWILVLHSAYGALSGGRPCPSWAGGELTSYLSTELLIVMWLSSLLIWGLHGATVGSNHPPPGYHTIVIHPWIHLSVNAGFLGAIVWKSIDIASQWGCRSPWTIVGLVMTVGAVLTFLVTFVIFILISGTSRRIQTSDTQSTFAPLGAYFFPRYNGVV